ncbi:MAG: acyl-CoA dehydrogenase family protein, partial [Alphaproteobacteria bacterium]|nr:acyl-CoA dehydrogenase family protein [Alphaproteobacteria bacterium]
PEEYGGSGLDLVTRTLLAMEMAQHRAGLYAPCFGVFGGMGLAQLYDANDDQKERYLFPVLRGEKSGFFALTEPSGGSDPARAIQTRAVRDGDDWLINGQKIFISGADKGDFGLVFARTDPEKGRAGVTCFIVDADSPGFHVRRVVHTLRSTHYATELQFEDLRVPPENILGEVDGGFGIANERLTRNRIPYAAGCLGVAIRAQEMAIEYVKIRETFGDLLATRQTVQNMIIDNELDIRTARWLTLAAADKAERGEPFRAEAAMAKIAATEAGGRVVDRAMQIHGGYGVTKEFPFERWYREMRIRRIGEGPNEVQRLIIARDLIGGSFH